MSPPIQALATPHLQTIPGGCQPGTILHVTGTYTAAGSSLLMKLQSGSSGEPSDDVGLCVYARIPEKQLVCSCFTRTSGWSPQEVTRYELPITTSPNFDIAITCSAESFKVALNGQVISEFSHRILPASLTHIQATSLSGDLVLSGIWLETPHQPSYSAPLIAAHCYTPVTAQLYTQPMAYPISTQSDYTMLTPPQYAAAAPPPSTTQHVPVSAKKSSLAPSKQSGVKRRKDNLTQVQLVDTEDEALSNLPSEVLVEIIKNLRDELSNKNRMLTKLNYSIPEDLTHQVDPLSQNYAFQHTSTDSSFQNKPNQ